MSETPAYLRVAAELRRRIVEGELPPGARLPSRAALAEAHGVGPNVAISAVRLLMAEGLVHGRAGSGVFVREPTALRAVVRSWHDERLGGTLYVPDDGTGRAADGSRERVATAVLPAPVEIAERLGVDPEAPVVHSEYTFLADGEAGMLSSSWEPLALTEGTPVALPDAGPLAGHGVVARMAHIGVTVDRATESVTGRAATPEEAERLGLAAGAHVQALQRTYYAGDRAVETADLVVPASRFRLVYEFPVGG
ncbi:GntR family transcriptional regulator [Streptomyces sp. NPDC127098]|uniref:GntR family transcriptional regulator n=1 Tax=Streptomyces sp. NPDC127098 TaxID=3347137 RepID=UPI003647731F